MPASPIQYLIESDTPQENFRRSIDDYYHLSLVAENSEQIREYLSQFNRMQYEASVANLRGMAEIANRQNQTNDLLSTMVESLDNLNFSIDKLNSTTSQVLEAVQDQTEVLQRVFEQLREQHHTLEQIHNTLLNPNEAEVEEYLRTAHSALKAGMESTVAEERKDHYEDAMDALNTVLKNPIGKRKYVAWFQKGWLQWKHEQNIAEAEEAFNHAARLSKQLDVYHVNSLRHLAYMQYLQKKHEAAYETIHKALKLVPDDYDIRYDTARYAAKVGREGEALDLLSKCIDQQPQTIITMFAEEDFLE